MDENEDLVKALAGRYDIEREIGRGGMAIVYLARDVKRARPVAVKVLRPELTASLGPQRFLREIAITASLVHPNILALYDSDEASGFLYYVMPYVDGPSLGQRVEREVQLPLDDVLAITRQVGAALDYAHARGVIHRDIKPDNILLLGEHVLVADFGLARAISSAASTPLTEKHFVVGTAAYMSPEQCTPGRAVDARSDIYSLGCVVFEMITGMPPFRGATIGATMSHHLTSDPPSLRTERSSCPQALDDVVRRALAKTPADRFRTAGEFVAALSHSAVRDGKVAAMTAPVVDVPPRRWRRFGLVAVVLGLVVIAALAGTALMPRNSVPQVVTFSVPPPTGAQFTDDLRDVSAVSPDGRDIVVVGSDSTGTKSLWLRPLAERAARRIPGTDFGSKPFWSPDGKMIGYFVGRSLAVIDRAGGASRTLVAKTPDPHGGSWSDNGTILYAPSSQSGIFLASLADSTSRRLTTPDTARGEIGHQWPHALPGGRDFLYFVASNIDSVRGIYLGSVDSPRGRRVVGSPASAVYSNGHLLYVHDSTLVAQRFDIAAASLVGDRKVIADSVATSYRYYGAFSASQNGVLVYAAGRSRDISRLEWLDSTGTVRGHASAPGYQRNPDLSANGRYLAFEIYRQSFSDIRYVDLATGVSSVLPDGGTQALVPTWSPDGTALAFIAELPGGWGIYRKYIHRADAPELLLKLPHYAALTDWSARDQTLILAERNDAGDLDLIARKLAALDEPVVLADGLGTQAGGRVSPAGDYLAYDSWESGAPQIYAQRFPATRSRCQVSSDGGMQAVWGARAGELYFLSPNGTLMKAMLDLTQPAPCPLAPPRAMFQTPIRNPAGTRSHFDVSLKDGRMLFNLPSVQDGGAWLNVIVNWLAAVPSPQ
jgi:eukaryotic-like serine/threonine-protein kinase